MKNKKVRQTIKESALILTGALLYSFGTLYFIVPAEIAPGGASGIALMINHLTDLPVGMLTLLINLPLLLLAWRGLGHRFTIRTAIAVCVVNLIMDVLIAPFCPQYTGERLMGSLYGGVVVGIGMALIFTAGYTTGGSDIAGYLLQKKFPHFSIGRALMMIDVVILLLSILVFSDVDAGLFGLIGVYVQTKIIDAVIYGSGAASKATIITKNGKEISARVIAEMNRSATILKGKGAYSGDETEVLLCTVRKSEFAGLKAIVSECDENAFVIVDEASEVWGEGFKGFRDTL